MGLPRGLRKYVESEDKSRYNRSEYNKRLINFCYLMFKDFVSIIENMDDDVQAKIFNAENLKPFFSALFSVKKGDSDAKRKRILKVVNALLVILSGRAPALAPNAWRQYTLLKGQTVDHLALVWAESLAAP